MVLQNVILFYYRVSIYYVVNYFRFAG